ncbi:MAG: UDP-glucose 4-epimerase GalE [Planctomycetes bacterium]|nr:UDP-glucose 4-epimerase GalE [Planctomycetota bacterium]
MKSFVTGGAGYVGSHCVRALCDGGHTVVVYDNLTQGHVAAVDPRAELVKGDLADRELLDRTLGSAGFSGVMHFAASLNVNESVRDPLAYYRNNVVNSVALLESMHAHDVHKIVFSSSCATYGTPPCLPITEETPQMPVSPYGRTKWTVEMALRDFSQNGGLGSISLRYFNASGAASDGTLGEDRDPEYHLIPIVLQVPLGQREKVFIFGTDYPTPDGTAVRDYIHVEDLATAHLLALEAIQEGQALAFNVGTGRGYSVREVIEAARRVSGHAIPAEETDRREGDPPELYADNSLIRDQLGWHPEVTDISEIVASAWRWHEKNPEGYEG